MNTGGGHFESKFWCDAFGVVAWDWGLQCRQRTHTRAVKFPTYVITISQRYTDGRTDTDRQTDRQKTCCSNRRHRLIIRTICDVSQILSPVEFFISVYRQIDNYISFPATLSSRIHSWRIHLGPILCFATPYRRVEVNCLWWSYVLLQCLDQMRWQWLMAHWHTQTTTTYELKQSRKKAT